MKTNYLSNEQVNGIRVCAKLAQEANDEISVIINEIKKQMKKQSGDNTLAKAIDANFKLFKGSLFPEAMPHYRKNGCKTIIVCDWVEQKGNKGMNLAFSEFRYIKQLANGDIVREEETKLDECVGNIVRDLQEQSKVTITYQHPSGYEESFERPAKDAEGNNVYESVATKLIPREKTQWGYTDVVIEAFIEAADRLMGMIANGEIK